MSDEYLFDALDRIRYVLEEIRDRLPAPKVEARPCDCVGCICVKQVDPRMMLANTYCKMPMAATVNPEVEGQ